MKHFSILLIIALMFAGAIQSNSQTGLPTPPQISWTVTAVAGDFGVVTLKPTDLGGVFTINGRPMAAGDALGAFFYDGAVRKCAGYMVWQGTSNTNNFAVIVWQNDTIGTGAKNGFDIGEPINWVMWDNVLQEEAPVTSMICNTNGIPSLSIPPQGPCLANFAGDMMFMYDEIVGYTLGVPTLTAPADLATDVSIAPTMTWTSVATATGYQVQVSESATFATLEKDLSVTNNTVDITGLSNSTTYFWRVRAVRGTEEGEWTLALSFTTIAPTGYSLTGTIKYANNAQTVMNNCTVVLKDGQGQTVATVVTDIAGAYSFTGLPNGSYTLEISTVKTPGGLSAIDAARIRQHVANTVTPITPFNPMRLKAANVNMDAQVNAIDAVLLRRKVSNLNPPQWTIPNFVFHPTMVTINGANEVLNVQSLSGGDVDGSFTPSGN